MSRMVYILAALMLVLLGAILALGLTSTFGRAEMLYQPLILLCRLAVLVGGFAATLCCLGRQTAGY